MSLWVASLSTGGWLKCCHSQTLELITCGRKADSATVHLSLRLLFQTAAVDLTDWRQAHLNKTECGHPAESVTETKHVGYNGPLVYSNMADVTFREHFR